MCTVRSRESDRLRWGNWWRSSHCRSARIASTINAAPANSATASAQYLKQLHDRFGDWRLALAAYNCGEGTVQKLLTRYKTQRYDGIAEHLPAETQMYVPRVEAVIQQREGAKLEQLSAL